ncbi:MAG: glycosyltransferase [Chitinivibrionales bacterium]|nr:glycosyltransferase [Chitinivibrionales bacterium]MBD3357682.1 glycosyltransferase [Chitinivibrionales bacterium]
MKISVVVPLLNERESLPLLAKAIDEVMVEWGKEYEILFVDDGSTDGSFATCGELREMYGEKVKVYKFGRNYGKAAALRAGIEHADGDVIVTMDADLQDDPKAIPAMVAKLDEGYDLVSGWKKKRHDPLNKTLPSKVWNTFTSKVSGIDLHDFNCGFKAYRAATAKSLDIYGERHRYLPVLAHWDGFRVTEIPVPHHPRKYGRSKYGISRFAKGILDLVTLMFLRRYLKNPLHFFGLLGILFGMAGGAILAYFGIQWALTGVMRVRPLVLLSVGAIIMGIQFISIGLIGEMITHAFPAKYYTIRESLE